MGSWVTAEQNCRTEGLVSMSFVSMSFVSMNVLHEVASLISATANGRCSIKRVVETRSSSRDPCSPFDAQSHQGQEMHSVTSATRQSIEADSPIAKLRFLPTCTGGE